MAILFSVNLFLELHRASHVSRNQLLPRKLTANEVNFHTIISFGFKSITNSPLFFKPASMLLVLIFVSNNRITCLFPNQALRDLCQQRSSGIGEKDAELPKYLQYSFPSHRASIGLTGGRCHLSHLLLHDIPVLMSADHPSYETRYVSQGRRRRAHGLTYYFLMPGTPPNQIDGDPPVSLLIARRDPILFYTLVSVRREHGVSSIR